MRFLFKISVGFLLFTLYACSSQRTARDIESQKSFKALKIKYAKLLEVSPAQIKNKKLYTFIDDWMGVRYKYGGSTKSGVDCSAFSQKLYAATYDKNLDRTTKEIYKKAQKINKRNLKEGYLVFFTISKKKNAHMGIYLQNNKFVHASSSKGVMISSLDESYWKKSFAKGGYSH